MKVSKSNFKVTDWKVIEPGGPIPQKSVDAMVEILLAIAEQEKDEDWPLQSERDL